MSDQGRFRSRLERYRLVSPTGADVVSLRDLPATDRFRVLAPSVFTLANMACGFGAVLVAFREEFRLAAALIAAAIVMDILDGFVARLVGATSPFGVQLDSMADLVSFGMAPAVLVHTWALAEWPVLSWVFAALWLACAAFRLARFNVTVDPLADKRYFIGLPSPGAAAVPIATIFALETAHIGPRLLLPLGVSAVPAVLMVTSVRFKSFRSLLAMGGGAAGVRVALAVVTVLALAWAPGLTGIVLAYGYVLTAPLGWATAPLRARLFGSDAVAPPRYRLPSVFLTPESTADGAPPPDEAPVG
ncbi:MAG: CDP-diacylglycerol--serine O-phosphatidyltransferase [Nostocoides sp.]